MCSVWKLQHNLKYVTYVLAIIYLLEKLYTVVTTTIICERYNVMCIVCTYVRSKSKRIRNMLAWDWLYEWMIKQVAQAGFYMTSSPNITGFFYNSENEFVKWSE